MGYRLRILAAWRDMKRGRLLSLRAYVCPSSPLSTPPPPPLALAQPTASSDSDRAPNLARRPWPSSLASSSSSLSSSLMLSNDTDEAASPPPQ
jgi:hypothetical protein